MINIIRWVTSKEEMKQKITKKISEKCKKIKLIVTDVDGVLTDGSRFYDRTGECFKNFNNHDGMGVNLLLRNNIPTVILTKEKSLIVKKWASDMNISGLFWGAKQKELELIKINKKFSVKNSEIAFIGDDVNDIDTLLEVGFSACPLNANYHTKENVDYICNSKAGQGCFREISDLILSEKFPHKKKWY